LAPGFTGFSRWSRDRPFNAARVSRCPKVRVGEVSDDRGGAEALDQPGGPVAAGERLDLVAAGG
jgi:hypothetical protein